MPYIQPGDRVDVVLDCVRGERGGVPCELVYVRGVFPPGHDHPPLLPGATRNVWQTFWAVAMNQMSHAAFAIPTTPTS
jgi:hypothetical protein